MRKNASDCVLSQKQEAAILILLRPFHGTLRDVAKSTGVSFRTLQYWLTQPHFQAKLREGRAELWKESMDNLSGSLNWATRVLVELLKSSSDSVKHKAASTVVHSSLKVHEQQDIEERLTALEQELARRKNKGGI